MPVLLRVSAIFLEICLPIIVLMAAGWGIDRKFKLDLNTMVRLNLYLLVPCFIFVRIYGSDATIRRDGPIVLFTLTMLALLFGLCALAGRRLPAAQRKSMMLAMFYNCGNFGIPLVALAFGKEAQRIQVFALLAMNISTFSVGLLIAAAQGGGDGAEGRSRRATLLLLLRQPSIYAITAAFVCKALPIGDLREVPWVWTPLEFAASALIGFALITLGVQLSKTRPSAIRLPVVLTLAIKLLIAPLVAWPLTRLFGFDATTSAVLIAGTSAPTAINTALLAHEFKGDSQFAASAVFYSTVLSVVTVTIVLALLGVR